ncbi:IS1595 family transposase [Aliihoeflea sp. 40Bstr573]|uniref:IS1595 family transposase n=1 Tax=Aliihoeflea sp. 40Bstr573 TaxID=2696467 RepID=UPI002094A08F|nr:IS1595 family transposase [Aliihoeflea sp. 40Bstr573]MCO6389052.1 IS1595 family transposase [Aliihoeflea sp. 40Bstr573]
MGQGQHFLLSAKARTLSVLKVARLSEDEARETFRLIRWCDTDGDPVCPGCACQAVYRHRSRQVYSCQACGKQFSVTTGTIFANRKLPIRTYLLAIAMFVNAAKGYSALQLSRDLDVQYKTAYVLCHKIREAVGVDAVGRTAQGEVEIDGAYFGGYVKPSNYVENRRDRRLAKNQNGKRRVVVVMRERGGRTLPFVVRKESQSVPEIERRITLDSIIHADEALGWDPLHMFYEMRRINHQEAYSDGKACTNHAESFFSRIRRAEIGQHHHISGPYLDSYAREMAWREDTRRSDNGTQFLLAAFAALSQKTSERWQGYWQRHIPKS